MDCQKIFRRELIVILIVALLAAVTVYGLHGWFHALFEQAPLVDAVGTAVAILLAFIATRVISMAIYRDRQLGLSEVAAESKNRLDSAHTLAVEVSGELEAVPGYNDVVRGKLADVIENTEQAAFAIVERLQTIDAVVDKLERFVAGTAD